MNKSQVSLWSLYSDRIDGRVIFYKYPVIKEGYFNG